MLNTRNFVCRDCIFALLFLLMKSFIDEYLRFLPPPQVLLFFFSSVVYPMHVFALLERLFMGVLSITCVLVGSFFLHKHHNIISGISFFHAAWWFYRRFQYYLKVCAALFLQTSMFSGVYYFFKNSCVFLLGTCSKMSSISLTFLRKISLFCRRIKQFIVYSIRYHEQINYSF